MAKMLCNICIHRPKGRKRGQSFMGSSFSFNCEECIDHDNFKRDPKKKVRRAPKTAVWQNHHIIYQGGLHASKQKDITRRIRMGIHSAITIIRRFKYLSPEEVDAIKVEAELRRSYNPERDIEGYVRTPDDS